MKFDRGRAMSRLTLVAALALAISGVVARESLKTSERIPKCSLNAFSTGYCPASASSESLTFDSKTFSSPSCVGALIPRTVATAIAMLAQQAVPLTCF